MQRIAGTERDIAQPNDETLSVAMDGRRQVGVLILPRREAPRDRVVDSADGVAGDVALARAA